MTKFDLFMWIRKKVAEVVGEDKTYDYLPDLSVTNFAYISVPVDIDINTKTNIGSTITAQIDFYTDDWRNKIDFVDQVEQVRHKLRFGVRDDKNGARCKSTSVRYVTDNTTSIALYRAVLEVDFELF